MASVKQDFPSSLLGVASGMGKSMDDPHFHCDLELNYLAGQEPASYRYSNGRTRRIEPGRLFLFLALHPHQLERTSSTMRWATLPPATLLAHGLDPDLLYRILNGEFIWAARRDPADDRHLQQWADDLKSNCAHRRSAAKLEIEARVRRLWAEHEPAPATQVGRINPRAASAVKLAAFLIDRYRDGIGPGDAAQSAGLTIGYAGECFRHAFGLTMGDFLAQLRMSAAVGMLLATEHTILDIALASGYSTLSVFYAAFHKRHKCSPGHFRKRRYPVFPTEV